MSLVNRKLEHVEICLFEDVQGLTTTLLENVELIHQAMPGVTFKDVDTSLIFLRKRLSAPLMVTGMTGGSQELGKINSVIAQVVEEKGLAMGVGSQRVALEKTEAAESFKVTRKVAPNAPLIANLGLPQLVRGYGLDHLRRAVEMIEADAIAIHLNPAQELFQPEGEPEYPMDALGKLRDISKELGVPVIIKETGSGISMETARLFRENGFTYFDVSGQGGTSWIAVETVRDRRRGHWKANASEPFIKWGIPTAASVVETRFAVPDGFLISSGGIRNGLDVAKSIVLGANMSGMANPVLAKAVSGIDSLKRFSMRSSSAEGGHDVNWGQESSRARREDPWLVWGKLREWMESRGITLSDYERIRRGG